MLTLVVRELEQENPNTNYTYEEGTWTKFKVVKVDGYFVPMYRKWYKLTYSRWYDNIGLEYYVPKHFKKVSDAYDFILSKKRRTPNKEFGVGVG